jgi:hypothetical protein
MAYEHDPLADDLRAFSEARKSAERDQHEAHNYQQQLDARLITEAPAAFADLRSKVVQRANRLASAHGEHNVECRSIGNTTTIGLGILEANVQFHPGRPADAFGPLLPFVTLQLSRTSHTIGADVMGPGMSDYRPPTPSSEEFRPVLTDNGTVWNAPSGVKSSADLAEHIVSELVQYFKRNQPR